MTAEDEIRDLVRQLFRAENHPGDLAAVGRVLAADYVPIVRGRGQVDRDRDDTLAQIARASPTFHRHADRAEIDVRLFPEGPVAVATSLLPTTDAATSPPTEADFRNTHVFLKRDGRWQCIAWQVTRVASDVKKLPEAFKAYEDGKHRRYGLLFAVNGGAFAVASLLLDKHPQGIGQLTPQWLAVGMLVFTLVMGWDIWEFGRKMRDEYQLNVFREPGQTVLKFIVFLISLGWALAAWPR